MNKFYNRNRYPIIPTVYNEALSYEEQLCAIYEALFNLETKMSENSVKKIIFLGDMLQFSEHSWLDKIIERFNLEPRYNYYRNESENCGFSTSGVNFSTLLTNVGEIEDAENISHIIVTGGYADYGEEERTIAGIESFVSLAHNLYPNALVVLYPLAYQPEFPVSESDAVAEWWERGAFDNGAICFKSGCNILRRKGMITSAGVTSNLGHTALANYISKSIFGGGGFADEKVYQIDDEIERTKTQSGVPGGYIVCFGDSWTEGTGAGDEHSEERARNRFSRKVADLLGVEERNFGVGGSQFSLGAMYAQIDSAIANMSQEEIAKTRYVMVCGGINDLRNRPNTQSAYNVLLEKVNQMCDTCAEIFTNAKIILVFGNWSLDGITMWWREFVGNIQRDAAINKNYRLIVVKNAGWSIAGNRDLYSFSGNAGLHPNVKGHAIFGQHIANAVLGGGDTVNYIAGHLTLDSDAPLDFYDSRFNVGINMVNGVCHTNPVVFTIPEGSSISGDALQIGSIPAELAPMSNTAVALRKGSVMMGFAEITSSGGFYICPLRDYTITGDIRVSPMSWLPGSRDKHA